MNPLRIAIISEAYAPNISGVTIFASRLVEGLTRMGHTVIVCAPSPTGRPYVESGSIVPIYRIRSIPNPFRKNFRLVVRQQRTMNRILGSFQPDIIHVQDPGGCAAAAARFGRRNRIPIIGTYHFSLQFISAYVPFSKLISTNVKPFIKAFVNDFYNNCTVITCPTETVRLDLKKQGITPPVRVISNGIDIHSPLSKIQRTTPNTSHPKILFVGRIDEDKNILLLLRSMAAIHEQTGATLRIVGTGDKLPSYKRWVKKHQLEHIITFVGSLPPTSAELVDEYRNATVFAMPSLIETQSIVTMEAMVAGIPVIAPRSGALPELIQHEKTGILVETPTPMHFAAAFVALLKQPELIKKYGEDARRAIEIHSIERALESFVSLYLEAPEMITSSPRKARRLVKNLI